MMRMTSRQFAKFSTIRLRGAGGGGGGGGPSTFRYIRVNAIATTGTAAMSCTQMEVRETSGGSNVATGGTPSAFATNNGFVPANAFDNNAGTFWVSTGGSLPYWLQYDFGSGVTRTIAEITWRSRTDGNYSEHPNCFEIIGSNDLTTWYLIGIWPNETGWTLGETRTYTRPIYDTGAHAYWRMRSLSAQGGASVALSELEFRATAGGPNLATGGTALAGSSFDNTVGGAGHDEINAFDGSSSTKWASASSVADWIGYHFASAVSINQIAVTSRNDGFFNQAPNATLVEWSDDGSTWTPAFIGAFGTFTQASTQTLTRRTVAGP